MKVNKGQKEPRSSARTRHLNGRPELRTSQDPDTSEVRSVPSRSGPFRSVSTLKILTRGRDSLERGDLPIEQTPDHTLSSNGNRLIYLMTVIVGKYRNPWRPHSFLGDSVRKSNLNSYVSLVDLSDTVHD